MSKEHSQAIPRSTYHKNHEPNQNITNQYEQNRPTRRLNHLYHPTIQLLWMDEILHHARNHGMMISLQITNKEWSIIQATKQIFCPFHQPQRIQVPVPSLGAASSWTSLGTLGTEPRCVDDGRHISRLPNSKLVHAMTVGKRSESNPDCLQT